MSMNAAAKWSVFEGFSRPLERRSWTPVAECNRSVEALLDGPRHRIAALRQTWAAAFVELGGDTEHRHGRGC